MMLPDTAVPSRHVPVIVKPEYIVRLSHTSGFTLTHADILVPWSPGVKAALLADWQTFTALHQAPLLAMHTPGDRKHDKFLRMFGFAPLVNYHDTALDAERTLYLYHQGNRYEQ